VIVLGHRWFSGSLAWVVHRATGIVLTLYLFAHLYVLSHLRDPQEFEALMAMAENPLVKLAEVGLLAAVAAHMLNGIRLTLLDLGAPTRAHKPLLAAALLAGAAAVLYGAYAMFGGAQ
jgi:succinate dehydrogenase / fumarate reductase cytochrome b subunit